MMMRGGREGGREERVRRRKERVRRRKERVRRRGRGTPAFREEFPWLNHGLNLEMQGIVVLRDLLTKMTQILPW